MSLCLLPCWQASIAVQGHSVAIPVSLEIQRAPFDSVASAYFVDLHREKAASISSAVPDLTLPLFLAANKLLCQYFRHLLPFFLCGHGAQLLSTRFSFPSCRALRERLRNKGV